MHFPENNMFFFSQINVVTSLDESEANSIVESKEVLNNFDLKISFSSIAYNLLVISSTIKKLETRGLSLTSASQMVSELEQEFGKLYDKRYYVKLDFNLEKNEVFSILREVNRTLTGRTKETDNEFIKMFSCSDLMHSSLLQ